jgi:hypothetical protein
VKWGGSWGLPGLRQHPGKNTSAGADAQQRAAPATSPTSTPSPLRHLVFTYAYYYNANRPRIKLQWKRPIARGERGGRTQPRRWRIRCSLRHAAADAAASLVARYRTLSWASSAQGPKTVGSAPLPGGMLGSGYPSGEWSDGASRTVNIGGAIPGRPSWRFLNPPRSSCWLWARCRQSSADENSRP